jgi:rRNA maturation endonuclease Nob1
VIIIILAAVLAIVVIAFILVVRVKDLPEPEPESPFQHLDDRKAAIYESLRDLQFEYRLGKLSDEDYQTSKRDLQKELAVVLADVDKLKVQLGVNGIVSVPAKKLAKAAAAASNGFVCLSCGAKFERELKFCGECGKPMKVAK